MGGGEMLDLREGEGYSVSTLQERAAVRIKLPAASLTHFFLWFMSSPSWESKLVDNIVA